MTEQEKQQLKAYLLQLETRLANLERLLLQPVGTPGEGQRIIPSDPNRTDVGMGAILNPSGSDFI